MSSNLEMPSSTTLLRSRKKRPPFAMLRGNAIEEPENSIVFLETNTENSSSSSSPTVSTGRKLSSQSIDSVVSLKHYDSLLGELRCPGCAKPMHAPILLCTNGHSNCSSCVKKLSVCPLCQSAFTETRSYTLEALAAKAHFLCKNAPNGCTVRLPYDLMKWHKERCAYQYGDCFMGKVWGRCSWVGCEIDWHQHCIDSHNDKIFLTNEAILQWIYTADQKQYKSVLGYYIFRAFGETFNLYHVYDKTASKLLWTMVCASKEPKVNQAFAFEIEIYSQNDPSILLVQRHGCHGERDDDVMEDGRCVSISMGEVMRFMSFNDKILNYHVKILEIKNLITSYHQTLLPAIENTKNSKPLPPIELLQIEGVNHKNVPVENIITKKIETIEKSFCSTKTADDNDKQSLCEYSCSSEKHFKRTTSTIHSCPVTATSSSSSLEEMLTQSPQLLKPTKPILKITTDIDEKNSSIKLQSYAGTFNSVDKDIAANKDLKQIFAKEFITKEYPSIGAANSFSASTGNLDENRKKPTIVKPPRKSLTLPKKEIIQLDAMSNNNNKNESRNSLPPTLPVSLPPFLSDQRLDGNVPKRRGIPTIIEFAKSNFKK